jgi:glutamine synthetase adenylyltransferase
MIDAVAFEQPERAARLWARWRGNGLQAELFDRFAPTLADALQHAPDPDRLLVNCDRWLESLGATLTYYRLFAETPHALKPVLAVLGASDYMADTLLQNPELSEILLDVRLLTRPRTRADMRRDLSRLLRACTTYWMQLDRLRAFKQQEYLRITALDLLGKATLTETMRALSDLADVCADAALDACHRELAAQQGVAGEHGFCILAMGKWGGRELNYSSDIDPIFLYRDAPRLVGAKDPTQYLLKLAEMVVKALSEPMRRGIVFRVDMRLRPEGRLGALARGVSSALHYYETWAEPWERQAMLKARPCAGDLQVGEQFLERLQPWLYRPSLSETDFAEIVRLRERAEAQARARNAYETDLKNGWGGIRDIEFSVQALQLMLGGRLPRLRTPATLDALQRLKHARILAPDEARALQDAYIFLRTAEHRLQLQFGHQTHLLPTDPKARARLAKLMGFAEPDAFEQTLARHRAVARAFRERVLRMPTSSAGSSPSTPWTSPSSAESSPSTPWTSPSSAESSPSTPWTSPSSAGSSPSTPWTSPSSAGSSPSTPWTSPSSAGSSTRSAETAVEFTTPSLRFPLQAGGTEQGLGSPREAAEPAPPLGSPREVTEPTPPLGSPREAGGTLRRGEELLPLLGTDEGAVVWESVLQSLGFAEPERAYRALSASLADAPPDERRAFEAILPALLTACARTPDPDRALTGLGRLADAFPSRAGLYLAFAESPEVLHRLAELAQSPALLNRLLAHLELLEMLFGEEIVARGAKSLQEHRDALAQRLERCRSASARLASLSAYMRREWLRIGARDLWSETTPLQTARDLAALARAVLPALWEQVAPDQTLWLIGFGSLGAGELGYQSDWDLAFACPDDADLPTLERHAQAFLAHCQRLSEQGVFPPVDTQLRPEGKAGALVRTVSGWRAYYAQAAAPWERLAAVRADVLNADADAPIVAVLNEYRFGGAPTPDERDEMRRLILRALTERVPSSALHTHLKLGYAGQNAIEFLTHWLVVQHATLDDHPSSAGTLTQLEWLWRRGILETADYDALREAWRMLYQVRNRLALLFDPAPEVLPDDSRLALLARSLNYDSPDALRRVLTEHQRAVEAITRRWW